MERAKTWIDSSVRTADGWRVTLVLVGLLLVVTTAGIVGVTGVTADDSSSTNGTLTGVVTDADSGEGIDNATVLAGNPDETALETTETDTEGAFELDLEGGVYTVAVAHPDFDVEFERDTVVAPGEETELEVSLESNPVGDPAGVFVENPVAAESSDHRWATLVTSEEPRSLEEIHLDYSDTGTDLSDLLENPDFSVFVMINGEPITGLPSLESDGETLTIEWRFDADPTVRPNDIISVSLLGENVVNPAEPGEYNASITLADAEGSFVEGDTQFSIMDAPGTITGTVTETEAGDGVDNATVIASNESDGTTIGALTDSDGNYSLTAPAGTYNVTTAHPDYEPATDSSVAVESNETTRVDPSLVPFDDEGPAVENYTNDDGIVDAAGLQDAIDDWRSDEIGTDLLREVIDAWRNEIVY